MLLCYKKKDGSIVKIRVKQGTGAPPVTIGRDREASIQIDDPKCSRIHAAIRYWDDVFVVRDMGSHNGTQLNGAKIEIAYLKPGDVITIGDTEIYASGEGTQSDVTISV